MGSISIQGLLAAYKARLRAPQGIIIQEVVVVCGELGLSCTVEDFGYTPATKLITTKVVGPKKTEILMRKTAILGALSRRLRVDDCPKEII
ncbi:MAG: hypothetical protein RLZZ234_667 [Candidatus Parcubacteria bacterium]|jgi:hypothetical protein